MEVTGPGAEARMWDLNLEGRIRKLTWWWWWWLFFLPDPEHPGRTRQLMILWSTKYTKWKKVMDQVWRPQRDIDRVVDEDGVRLAFDGMTAAWWWDGRKMHDPLILEQDDFTVEGKGGEGLLNPHSPLDLRLQGSPQGYRLDISMPKEGHEFHLKMRPWTDFMSLHRFRANNFTKKYSYNILRIYGSKVSGSYLAHGEEVDATGTAYFQKVRVNAPGAPWYWCVLHTERGDYLDYFLPHLGLTIFRQKERPKSWLDRGEYMLGKSLQFWEEEAQFLHKFKRVRIRKTFTDDDLPVFHVHGENDQGTIELELESYARAYWRFEQPWLGGLRRSVLFYNEYPIEVRRFELTRGSRRISLDDLGWVTGNCEHTWGKLL
jgi:hypothetical protein